MNRHEKAQEFETKFYAGEIGACSIKELQEYIEVLSDFSSAVAAKYPERASHIQILNTLISVKTLENVNKTIEHTETTIKKLNDKNSLLTWVVVVLALLSLIASGLQIYFTVRPPSKAANQQSQEIHLQKSDAQSLQNLPSKEHASKLSIAKQKYMNTPESKLGKTEAYEKESYHPPKPPK